MPITRICRIGVLGAAAIAERSVLPSLATLPNHFVVSGIASRSTQRASTLAREYGCKAYDNYGDLIADDQIDAVYIPLPNSLHAEWVTKALQHGKHVLCEKSLACSQAEAIQMVDVATKNNLALIENFQFRFHSQLRKLKELIGVDGTAPSVIGSIRAIRCSFGFPPFPDADNIRYSAKLGGGALLDAGAYTIKAANLLLGPTILSGASLTVDRSRDIDLHGGGLLISPNTGVTAHLAFGFDHFYQCGVEVWGSEGVLRTNRLFTARASVAPQFEIESNEKPKQTLALEPDDHFRNMLLHFHDAMDYRSVDVRQDEYDQNLAQATMLEQFRSNALLSYA